MNPTRSTEDARQGKDLARAMRRHHIARLKQARKRYWGRPGNPAHEDAMGPRVLGMVVATPASCSCASCGNQRPFEGDSIQERRLFQDLLQRE